MAKDEGNVKDRLSEATANCLKAFDAWESKKKDSQIRENLREAVHELRKVAARLEISVAVSERDEITSKPIPIPSHRSSRKGGGGENGNNSHDHGQAQAQGQGGDDNQQGGGGKPRRGRRPRQQSGGGNSNN